MNIFDQEVQLILNEINSKKDPYATYERNALGDTRYVTVSGELLKSALLGKYERVYTYATAEGGKKNWWLQYGDEARSLAKKLHLKGPNIIDIGPLLTPELVTIQKRTHRFYNFQDGIAIEEMVKEILEFLGRDDYIMQHPKYHFLGYAITGKGRAYCDRKWLEEGKG